MTDTTMTTLRPDSQLDRPRVDATSALDRLRILISTPPAAAEVMDRLSGVLVPHVADRCVVDLSPERGAGSATPVQPTAPTTAEPPIGVHALSVPFTSAVQALRGTVSCGWNDGYQPSAGDEALVRTIVDQCMLLADRTHLAEEMEQLQAYADQLRTAVETNRRIGAAIGVLMVRYGLTEDQAFEALRLTSNTSNRKLRDVADEVLYTGSMPDRRGPRRSRAARDR